MRSIGLPELLVIFGVVFMLALPVALIALMLVMSHRKKRLTTSVRACPNCGQHMPSQASFCSLCGKRVV